MEIVLILALIFIGFSSVLGRTINSEKRAGDARRARSVREDAEDSFHPEDDFYLEDGLDHEIDDGYCEECDDFHEQI
jgi:hypothetical protein